MTKPRLPEKIEAKFPKTVLDHLYGFVPHFPKLKKPSVSPSFQKALERLQQTPKRNTMDMYGLDDFVLC